MAQETRIRHTAFGVAAACVLAASGCATSMVPSQRLHEPELTKVMSRPIHIGGHRFAREDSSECCTGEERQRLEDYARCAAPYVAGPFIHHESAVQQATIEPPHSKFHPVPTRPVFETRASYHPPQPIGVHLVPVPDQTPYPMTPRLYQPESQLGLPPTPSTATPDSMDALEFDENDKFILPPPSD